MGKTDPSALDGGEIILSAAIPEGIIFRTTPSGRHIIRVWCMMDEDEMARGLMCEFSIMTLEKLLKNLGCSRKQIFFVLNILMQSFFCDGLDENPF
jgi:hypothetical protein